MSASSSPIRPMNACISSAVIASRSAPSTLWTDSRYCAMVLLLWSGMSSPHHERACPRWTGSERVDPALQIAGLAGEDLGFAEGVREECGSLDAGEERVCEVARVAPAELAELVFRPIDDAGEHRGAAPVELALDLVELRAEGSDRAAVAGYGVALVIPVSH